MTAEPTERILTAFPLLCRELPLNQGYEHFECGDGWGDLIFDMLVEIDKAFGNQFQRESFILKQVKNKFGLLRVYFLLLYKDNPVEETWQIGLRDSIRRAIDKAEVSSKFTCEKCGGKIGNFERKPNFSSLCEKCYIERVG